MTAGFVLAPARLWHLPRLAAILWHFTRTTPWLPIVRTRIDDLRVLAGIIRRGWVHLVRDAGLPVGFIARDGTRIHALYIHPCAQGRGFGGMLLNQAKTQSDQLELWVVEHNLPAREFYAAQGFAEVAPGYGSGNDEKLPDILMVWTAKQKGQI